MGILVSKPEAESHEDFRLHKCRLLVFLHGRLVEGFYFLRQTLTMLPRLPQISDPSAFTFLVLGPGLFHEGTFPSQWAESF